MVDRAYRLSFTEEAFTKECDKLRTMFSKLRYPNTLVNSITVRKVDKFKIGTSQKMERMIFFQTDR